MANIVRLLVPHGQTLSWGNPHIAPAMCHLNTLSGAWIKKTWAQWTLDPFRVWHVTPFSCWDVSELRLGSGAGQDRDCDWVRGQRSEAAVKVC